MRTEQLTDFERDVLRAANGEDATLLMGERIPVINDAVECLYAAGLVKLKCSNKGLAYVPTKKGRKALKDG